MNSKEAFIAAERKRRSSHAVSQDQRRHLKRLSLKAGVVMPRVFTSAQATDAITRLEERLKPHAQQELEGFRAVSGR